MGGMTMAAKKIPCLMPSEREAVLKLCRQEFRALQRVQHENIVQLIGVIVDDVKSVTLLMELAKGGSLRSLLTAHPEKVVGVLGTQRQLLRGIAVGMAFLHSQTPRPILHHDLKTDNVLVWADEATGGFHPKVTDFGLATGTGNTSLRSDMKKTGAGTLAYKAPECFANEFTTASESYAYGVVGFEVLTAQLPWEGKIEPAIIMAVAVKHERPPLPSDLGSSGILVPLIERCWAQEPRDRPSFAEAAEAPELAIPKGASGAVGEGDAVLADKMNALADKMNALLAMQQQLAGGMRDLGSEMRQMSSVVQANSSMLGALLQDEHGCPRWLTLVPKSPGKSALSRAAEWLKPKNWINKTVVLFFVCPVTKSAVGKGFELELPRDWVVKYGPAIRVGITLLKMGTAGARLAGLPVPSLSDLTGMAMESLEEQTAYLTQVTTPSHIPTPRIGPAIPSSTKSNANLGWFRFHPVLPVHFAQAVGRWHRRAARREQSRFHQQLGRPYGGKGGSQWAATAQGDGAAELPAGELGYLLLTRPWLCFECFFLL